jgi:tRNA modification GTPase
MTPGDTIVAPATPFGYSGVAVIRISGPNAFSYLSVLSGKKTFKDREATVSSITDNYNTLIDRCLVTAFYGPRSYTGDDLVEVSTHGNPAIIDELVRAFCHLGARPAGAGEFTQRAFLNGKMDLIQVEAVASLIHSKSIENARCQHKILTGSLSILINDIRKRFVSLLSQFEYRMDLSEEETHGDYGSSLLLELTSVLATIKEFKKSFYLGRLLNRGASVVITGTPNVGKSSLLNYLSGSSRAIVSDVPGTTRDTIEVELVISGVPVLFVDTAGIRESKDVVEKEGVSRAKERTNSADLIISLTDDPQSEHLHYNKTPTLRVVNKLDRRQSKNTEDGAIHISVKKGLGFAFLNEQISLALGINKISTDETYISTARQHRAMVDCSFFIKKALTLTKQKTLDLELLSFEVRAALTSVDEILGKTTSEDILNNVFGSLCVGK